MFDESFSECWRLRFGTEPLESTDVLAPFMRHRSVRKYSDRPVEESLVASLIGCAQSAATSSNLQVWSVVSVQDPDRRERMAQLCGDQKQVRTAPWFLAFLADHHRLRRAAEEHGETAQGLGYAEFYGMALIDAALACERLVCAAESIGLGICYIGALRNDPAGVKEHLGLPEGAFGAFGLCLGWPHEDAREAIKPRLAPEAVWFRETYNLEPGTHEYDDRMREFYEAQQMKGDVTWSMRSGRRVDGKHMTGREVLKPWLESQGFNKM